MPDPTTRSEPVEPPHTATGDAAAAPDVTSATAVTGSAGSGSGGRVHLVDLALLALGTIVLRLPAFLSPRHLTFDDGVFASSVIAMRQGGVPFRDVFSSQGPLFLPLAYLGDLLGFRTMDSPRVLAVVSGVVVVLGVYWCATRLTDRTGALLAGVLAATSGCLMWVTAPLAADGPALAFAVLALGSALDLRLRPTLWRAVLLGLFVGAALSTKAMEAPILAPVVLVLLAPLADAARRRRLDAAALWRAVASGAAAGLLFLAVSLPFGFADVWDQSFDYRTDAAADRDVLGNAGKILSTLWDRDLVLYVALALTLVCAVTAHRRTGSARQAVVEQDASWWSRRPWSPAVTGAGDDGTGWVPSGRLLVTSWTVVTVVWMVLVVSPLWRPHVSAVVPPLVLMVALYRPPLRPTLVLGVLCLPLLVIQLDGLLAPGDYAGSEAEVVAALRDLPEGAWVLSDEPGLVWRAGLRTTDDLVDPSMLRVQQGRYTEDSLARAAADPRVCAVVVRSDERFGAFPGLGDRLADEGYEVAGSWTPRSGDDQRLYVRSDCDPTG
jgi:4-amino-4-deoxy-L-arabinose transferase-like glycosyltransferase